ncbi:MAG: hypothetical protein DRG63_00780 [Deltaproteobacteria bacterium]|nr:MAG: hypothetical protein DRG63_00780 [Deltaproteobacteria bacterium]
MPSIRPENGFRPLALICWTTASIITAVALLVLFSLAVTLWVGYTHRELHGSWVAIAIAMVLIPACLYIWLKPLMACTKKAKKPELLEP